MSWSCRSAFEPRENALQSLGCARLIQLLQVQENPKAILLLPENRPLGYLLVEFVEDLVVANSLANRFAGMGSRS